ncbi:nucleotidyltransferase [Candidatus Woesearchaeota archaeon]|nr:nucleotidyltransferase [Candidatus Woesearchaeota archaeon]
MIETFTEIEKLFVELNNAINTKVNVYVIGGAALLKRGMKAATKDIDLIVANKEAFFEIQNSLKKINFVVRIPSKEYANMNLNQIFQRDDFRIDLFETEVCGKFSLSQSMIQRAEKVIELSHITVFLCSNEDIFLFKTMTQREGDLTDCISISSTQNPNWDIILEELQNQIKQRKRDIWITWIGERLDILVERGVDIPIMDEVDRLRKMYFES